MAKFDEDSTFGSKLLKLFRILLADQRKHYLKDLKESLNCSSQTVLRLMSEIERELGSNLEMGKNGRLRWYRLAPQTKTGRLMLDDRDLRFMEICRDLADPYLPEQVKKRIDHRLWDLSVQLSEQNSPEDDRFAFFSKGYINYSPYFGFINKLLDAINDKKICFIRYKPSGSKDINLHYFAPCKIAGMNGALYALGTYVQNDLKTPKHLAYYAVHRILDVEVTSHVADFNVPKIDFKLFGLPWHEPETFRIKFKAGKSADYVRERIWGGQQKLIEEEDGGVILEITTTSEPELMSWVRSFGDEAKILK